VQHFLCYLVHFACFLGAILDKPEPPPTFMKPRTMSTSSGKTGITQLHLISSWKGTSCDETKVLTDLFLYDVHRKMQDEVLTKEI